LQHWDVSHFLDLLESERDTLGKIYQCHKKDGKMCTGWIMEQDKNRIPSIMLRLKFSRDGTTVADLDTLKCKSELYNSIREMCEANYPELKKYYEHQFSRN